MEALTGEQKRQTENDQPVSLFEEETGLEVGTSGYKIPFEVEYYEDFIPIFLTEERKK
jgi:hypothetical protein